MQTHSRLDASPEVIECVPLCLSIKQKLRINIPPGCWVTVQKSSVAMQNMRKK